MTIFTPRSVRVLAAQAKKKSTRIVLAILTLVVVVISLTSEPRATKAFTSGTGTIADPYVISTCAELQEIDDVPEYMYASFVLANDIDCSAINPFPPLGTANMFSGFIPFMGRLDGQGNTISNVTIGSTTADYAGIFAETWGASIRNLNLDNFTIDGNNYVGAISGRSYGTALVGISLTNSTVTAHQNNASYVGSIVGRFLDSYAYGLYATSTTLTTTGSNQTTGSSGSSGIGGLIGNHLNSILDRSASGVSVITDYSGIGGLVGTMQTGSVIKNSYVDGVVVGYDNVGGIVGYYSTFNGNRFYVDSVYSNASTTATNPVGYVGGILGYRNGGSSSEMEISNSFSFGKIGSTTRSGGISGSSLSASLLTNNVYYPTGTGQTRCVGAATVYTAGQCTSNDTASYYYSSANAPLSSWDFTGAWNEYGGALPDLQVFPFAEPVAPVAITTCTELATNIRQDPNGWYELSSSVDCAGDVNLLPLTGTTSHSLGFVGTLDGQGNTISGITLSKTTPYAQDYKGAGLFAQLAGATIQNVTLAGGGVTVLDADVNGAGALAGNGYGVLIDGVTSTVPVFTGDAYGGGLIGNGSGYFNNVAVNADVDYSYVAGDATAWIGGIIGTSFFTHITNSSYSGNIRGYYYVGGIVGYASHLVADGITVSGTISANSGAGGVIGTGHDDGIELYSSITNATSTVDFSPDVAVDGFIYSAGGIGGDIADTNISNVTFTGSVTGVADGQLYGIGGIIGSYTNEETATTTFSNLTTNAYITTPGDNGSSPYLRYIGGLIGTSDGEVSITNSIASTTMRFGDEPASNYINGFSDVGGLIGEVFGPFEITSTETRGSMYVYDDYTGNFGGYSYGLGGFIGIGCCGIIENATSSVEIYVKSYEPGAIGGLIGEGGELSITNTNVTGSLTVEAPGQHYDIGGFIGYSYDNVIATSSAQGDVTILDSYNPYDIGGFIGSSYNDRIQQTYTDNTVLINMGADGVSTGYYIGGFLGAAYQDTTAIDTYASTTLTINSDTLGSSAATDIGGYVGYVGYISLLGNSFTNSYSTGNLNLVADVTAPFNRVGGFVGSSDDNANSFTDSFAATAIPAIASSTQVGGFIGSYLGGETFSNNAFDATRTAQSLCTGIDILDPAWCTIRNVASAEPTYFFDATNAPMNSWNFTTTWLEHPDTYPTFGVGVVGGPTAPTLTTNAVASGVTQTGATLAGNITALGSETVTARGIVYGTSVSFGATSTENSAGFSTGAFNRPITGLVCNTTYYFSAYASSVDGTGYGATESFTTDACAGPATPPTVSTSGTVSSITQTSATLSGNITALGSASITTRGFGYGTAPTQGATTTENSAGHSTGVYTANLTSLTCGTTYYFTAYATGADGTGYGTQQSFSTSACTPASSGSSGGSGGTRVKDKKDDSNVLGKTDNITICHSAGGQKYVALTNVQVFIIQAQCRSNCRTTWT